MLLQVIVVTEAFPNAEPLAITSEEPKVIGLSSYY